MGRREELRMTVARGYCHYKNSAKELDGDLLEAIVDELLAAAPASDALEKLRELSAKAREAIELPVYLSALEERDRNFILGCVNYVRSLLAGGEERKAT